MLYGLLEEPDGQGAEEGQERCPAEDVYVGHERGLLQHHAIEQSQGAGSALGASELMAEICGQRGGFLLEDEAGGREVGADFGLMQGCAADERGGGHGDADGAADVAEHVEEAGGVAHLFAGNGGGAHGGQRDEDEAQGESGDHDGDEQSVWADVEIDGSEDERADAEADESGAEQLAIVDAGAEDADDGRADEGSDVRADRQRGRR